MIGILESAKLLFFSGFVFSQPCVPAREEIKVPSEVQNTTYHRFHPSGNYYIVTSDKNAHIVDISKRNAAGQRQAHLIKTPMLYESYPVESGWKFIASPRDIGMDYYSFDDLLKAGEKSGSAERVKPVFADPSFGEYYHTSVELPGSTKAIRKIRTMLMNRIIKDYEIHFDSSGKFKRVKEISGPKPLCPNLGDLKDSNPTLSKDGKYFACLIEGTVRVFEVKENRCQQIADTKYRGSKVSFSYSKNQERPKIVFTDTHAAQADFIDPVVMYDLETERTTVLSTPEDGKFRKYPGFTEDGRIMFKSEKGLIILDPNQINGDKSKCIKSSIDSKPQGINRPGDR